MSLLWKRDAVRLRPGYGPRRRVLGDGEPAHGTSFPRLETLIRLADLYGVSLDVLLCRNQIFRFKEF